MTLCPVYYLQMYWYFLFILRVYTSTFTLFPSFYLFVSSTFVTKTAHQFFHLFCHPYHHPNYITQAVQKKKKSLYSPSYKGYIFHVQLSFSLPTNQLISTTYTG